MTTAIAAAPQSDFTAHKLKIAFACLIGLMLASGGFIQGAVSLVMIPLQKEFHWSRAAIGLGLTIMTWAGVPAMPLIGHFMDKLGSRRLLLWSAALYVVVTAAFAFVGNSLALFYGCFVLLGLLGASMVGYTKIVAALFTRHRGKALGIFAIEATVVAAALPWVMKWLLDAQGWRGIFIGLAILKAVVALPILWFMLEDPTEAKAGKAAAPQPAYMQEGMTSQEALAAPVFWLMLAANIGGGITIFGLFAHMVPMMTSRGLTVSEAVGAMSLMSLVGIIGQLTAGFVVDKSRSGKVAAAYLSLFLVGVVFVSRASAATGAWPLYLGIGLMGIGGGSQEAMRQYFFSRYFGLKAFAAINSWFRALQAAITGLAPWLIGEIYDKTGSYDFAFPLFGACALSGVVTLALLPRYRYAAAP